MGYYASLVIGLAIFTVCLFFQPVAVQCTSKRDQGVKLGAKGCLVEILPCWGGGCLNDSRRSRSRDALSPSERLQTRASPLQLSRLSSE